MAIEAARPHVDPVVRPRTPRHAAPWAGGSLVVLLVLVVLLQRLLIPPGAAPVALVVLLVHVVAALLLLTGRLALDRARTELFGLAALLVLVVSAGAAVTGGSLSVTSLGLLLVLWAPWVLRLPPGHQHVHRRVARAFVRLMVALALVGVAQLGLQLLGLWRYRDYLGTWVPGLIQDGFNTSIPIFFGSPVYKANAFVFLEPSNFSQYCALGILVGLVLREPAWKLLVLGLGLGSAVSGTGIVLLLVGAVLVVLRDPRALRPSVLAASALGVVALLLSPVFPLLLDRVDEPAQTGSSGYLRFVQPFTEVAAGLQDAPVRYVLGAGAGAVQRVLESGKGDTEGQAVLYSVIPKAVFEYGVVAGGVFVLFIALAVLDRAPWAVVPGAVLFWVLFLGGNLLQPQTVAVAWLLTSLFTGQVPGQVPGQPPRARAAPDRAEVTAGR